MTARAVKRGASSPNCRQIRVDSGATTIFYRFRGLAYIATLFHNNTFRNLKIKQCLSQ